MKFKLWAPGAREVALVLGSRTIPMERGDGGWWKINEPEAGPATDYQFSVNGREPLPDPRSPWQPHGVHGSSRVVDHKTFRWSDRGWQSPPLSAALIYEMHLGTFTEEGTFQAAIPRLTHLVELGVTHVEIMPICEFSGNYGWGYDGVDLYAPHHAYGSPDDFKALVNACHERGLGVILDVVYNHLGPAGNYLEQFGPYFTDRCHTPWGQALNFDGPDSGEVRRFFCDNALMWLRDYHVDGLRLDAVHAIPDESAIHILEQLEAEVEALQTELGRHLFLIAESDLNDPRILWPRGRGGYGMDAQWSDDFHHALHAVLTGEQEGYYEDFGRLGQLAKALERAFVYDGIYSPHRKRTHGRPATGLPGNQFVGYLQNHDQIGNRAKGDRSSHLLTKGQLKIGAAMVLASPFIPMLFQGEEWGASSPFLYFTSHEDPELGRAVREGRRREFAAFGWDPAEIPDPQAPETFRRSKLDWGELAREPHKDLFEWHKKLWKLRRSVPELSDGRLDRVRTRFDEQARWFMMERGSVTLAVNFSKDRKPIPLFGGKPSELLLSSEPCCLGRDDSIEMPGETVAIYQGE
jgi:maltooligosyltrehalose trehalohydrolase